MVRPQAVPLMSILTTIFRLPVQNSYYTQDEDGALQTTQADAELFKPFRHLIADITNHYTLPHRHLYNTACFDELLKLYIRYNRDETFYLPEYTGLSLVFSQIISNPLRTDNLEKSADFATLKLTALLEHINTFAESRGEIKEKFAWLTPELISNIAATIKAMDSFVIPTAFGSDYENDELYHDCAWVYDIMQSHLGADTYAFGAYEDALYCENITVPFDEYVQKRKTELQTIAKKPKIYTTPMMGKEFEKYARENIAGFDGSAINQPYDDDLATFAEFITRLKE